MPPHGSGTGTRSNPLTLLLARGNSSGAWGVRCCRYGSLPPAIFMAWGGTPVAYVPGLVMRRAAGLYPGEAKTDRRDAYILADTARTRRKQGRADQRQPRARAGAREPAGSRRGPRPSCAARRRPGQDPRGHRRRSPRLAAKTAEPVAKAVAAQDVTVPAEAATGRVIAELAGELDRARRDAETRSRRGNHRLKNAMFLAAFASLRDPRPGLSTTQESRGQAAQRRPHLHARRRCDRPRPPHHQQRRPREPAKSYSCSPSISSVCWGSRAWWRSGDHDHAGGRGAALDPQRVGVGCDGGPAGHKRPSKTGHRPPKSAPRS